jgi:hypothetical protein
MTASTPEWPEARVTGNATLLLGYLTGALMSVDDRDYDIVSVEVSTGSQVPQHKVSGNLFRMTVKQIGGVE